jgi:hypothetical protein
MESMVMTAKSAGKVKEEPRKERRQSNDFWGNAKTVITLVSWLLFLVALVISYYAVPEKDYGVLRYYDIEIRQFWLTPLTGYLYIMLWLSALGSYLALMVDKYRSRRGSDNTHVNLWFLLSINLTWLMYILVKAQ